MGTARRWLGLERRPPLPQLTRGCRGTNPSPPVPEGRKVTWRDRFSVPPPLREAPACLWPRGWADRCPRGGGTGGAAAGRGGTLRSGPRPPSAASPPAPRASYHGCRRPSPPSTCALGPLLCKVLLEQWAPQPPLRKGERS